MSGPNGEQPHGSPSARAVPTGRIATAEHVRIERPRRWGIAEDTMGMITVPITVRSKEGEHREVQALVDTGSYYTVLPSTMMAELGIEPLEDAEVEFANGDVEVWPLGEAWIEYQHRGFTCLVAFSPIEQYLLGATTLQVLRLIVDPTNERLTPMGRMRI